MQLQAGATVAVADGEKLHIYRNTGQGAETKLTLLPGPDVATENRGLSGHHSSAANPDESQVSEDSFAAGTAAFLNRQVLEGKISSLVVIAAPRTLGELRKHFHQKLSAVLAGEIAKDLTDHSSQDIEKAIASA